MVIEADETRGFPVMTGSAEAAERRDEGRLQKHVRRAVRLLEPAKLVQVKRHVVCAEMRTSNMKPDHLGNRSCAFHFLGVLQEGRDARFPAGDGS